jgi:hypothetical protein
MPDADQYGDGGYDDGVDQRLEADAAQVAKIAETRYAEREGGEDQRDHQHEEQAEGRSCRLAR